MGARQLRILCVIDHFGAGGAQRQLSELASGLAVRGHHVEVFLYHPRHDFFLPPVLQAGVSVHTCDRSEVGVVGVARRLTALARRTAPDVILTYLDMPSLLVELVRPLIRGVTLVVSERASHMNDRSAFRGAIRRLPHNLADHVVSNSYAQADWLRARAWLKTEVSVIYNGVPVQEFDPTPRVPNEPSKLRLLGIGRIGPEKNLVNLVRGLDLAGRELGTVPRVDWVGSQDGRTSGLQYRSRLDRVLADHPAVSDRWRFLGRRADIAALLSGHDALVHPAFHEGLPNVVCEALAAGRPVLASDRCDHPHLLGEGRRGLLFDPESPSDIARSIVDMARWPDARWRDASRDARSFAEQNLGTDRMIDAYERLFLTLRDGDGARE